MGIGRIILIGGEPTVYPHILPLIEYISQKNIKTALVTNGLVLSNLETVKKYMEAGVTSFSVSIKANNKDEYEEVTGSDCFNKVLAAISNLKELNASFSVSQVLTFKNIHTFADGIKSFKHAGASNFSFSFCYNFNCGNVNKELDLIEENPYILAELFKRNYHQIDKALDGCKYSLSQGLPLCVWDMEIIDKMVKKHSINSICQLLGGNGILFNTDLSLIPCNAMHQVQYGKFLQDFHNKETYETFRMREDVKELFAHLRGIPDYKCLECENAAGCGGGCVTNWTNYSFEELETTLKQKFIEWKSGQNG